VTHTSTGDEAEAYLTGHDFGVRVGEAFIAWMDDELGPLVAAAVESGVPQQTINRQVARLLRTTADGFDPKGQAAPPAAGD
jgi:hypothetical protein